ncbi:hypothetical protein CW354_03500 [Marinicaulis flavus]|uniref:DUF2155 domain-containing protein n=2 Tax=Hyphococcus luteus TaxID=2058213 RepID=A0A2S7K9V6_9PROT|nr:hypothetical protein CW354_03500 [Marinicaulis flavus]
MSAPLAAQAPADDEAADEPLSELDALSRSEDDPFAGASEKDEREPVSVTLRALNKITARYTDLEIGMNEIARFGSLEILPRTCDKRPPEEFPETTAFLEIYDLEYENRQSDLKIQEPEILEDEIETQELEVLPGEPIGEAVPLREADAAEKPAPAPEVLEGPQADGVNIFRGWMFASSPALNALEHPVYDVWVIDCKTKDADS